MEFVDIETAKSMSGMRLVVSRGNWALWSEFAKNIFHVKGIPYVAVAQTGFSDNAELVAWTGVRNQPQAIYNDDNVRTSWLDILNLAEKISPRPALLPEKSEDRASVVGIGNEICGEWGLGWCRRIQMTALFPLGDKAGAIMQRDYGQTRENALAAEQRCAEIIRHIASRLHQQAAAGSRYLVGNALTAADIYWACISNTFRTMSVDLCPIGGEWRGRFEHLGSEIEPVFDPILIEHRDYIYKKYLPLPIDFG